MLSYIDKLRIRLRIKQRVKSLLDGIRREILTSYIAGGGRRYADERSSEYDGAILTLPGYFNYGNMIQRFALQRFLSKKGYRFVSYVREMPIKGKEEAHKYKYTHSFVDKYIERQTYRWDDRPFGIYIVGSDQIWRNWGYDNEKDSLGFFFLNFVNDPEVKRVAYAASIGQDTVREAGMSEGFIEYITPYVERFNSVSLREVSGVREVARQWGVRATKVLDPTMLLEAYDYSGLIDGADYSIEDYSGKIFNYYIKNSIEKKNIVKRIARIAGLEVAAIDLDDEKKQLPPIEAWLAGIRDADLVVTDSFHGAVFSIIFNTPFILVESGTGGSDRLRTLLRTFGLRDRYLGSEASDGLIDNIIKTRISWSFVNIKLQLLRVRSAKWLIRAIIK